MKHRHGPKTTYNFCEISFKLQSILDFFMEQTVKLCVDVLVRKNTVSPPDKYTHFGHLLLRFVKEDHAKNGSQMCCHTYRLNTILLNNSLITFIQYL